MNPFHSLSSSFYTKKLDANHERQRSILRAAEVMMDASLVAAQARFNDELGWRAVEPRWLNCGSEKERQTLMETMLSQRGGLHRMSAPIEAGLRLGDASDELIDIANEWGRHAGVALEGLDHLNVLTSDPLTTGKDSLQDVRAGRLVLPLFLLRETVTKNEWEDIYEIIDKSDSKFTHNPPVYKNCRFVYSENHCSPVVIHTYIVGVSE